MATPKYTPIGTSLQSILDCLNDIAAYPGLKDKESLLKFYLGYTPFKQAVVMMLNPYYMYGIKDFTPCTGQDSPQVGFYELMELLEGLRTRQLTGNVARVAAGSMVAAGVPADLMIRFLNKDPKAGFGDTMVNKVCQGLLPEFPYMRCSLPEKSNMAKWDWDAGIISQVKADGMFFNVTRDEGGDINLMSRQGQIFPTKGFEEFHDVIAYTIPNGTQTHGEMVVYQDGKLLDRQTGNGIINSVAQGGVWPDGVTIQFLAWDQIPLSSVKPKGKYEVIYGERFRDLVSKLMYDNGDGTLKPCHPMLTAIPFKMVHSKKEAYQHFAEIVKAGGEGTVVKTPQLIWKDGTSKDQVKLKLAFVVDVEITGFTKGNGKFASTFGAVQYKSKCGMVKGQVSGMDDKTRKHVSDNRESYIGTIMAVEANAVFEPSASNDFYSLSHPRVEEFRSLADKSVADDLLQILAQQQAAIDNAAAI